MAAVPVLDLAAFGGAGRADAAWRLDRACRDIGFLVVTGHGVPAELIARMHRVTALFLSLIHI